MIEALHFMNAMAGRKGLSLIQNRSKPDIYCLRWDFLEFSEGELQWSAQRLYESIGYQRIDSFCVHVGASLMAGDLVFKNGVGR